MKLRASMLLAGLCTGILYGQTAASTTQPSAQGSSGSRTGAAPTRANGLPPNSPALSGTSASSGPLANANGNNTGNPALNGNAGNSSAANGSGNSAGAASGTAAARGNGNSNAGAKNASPAPAATANVEVTGFPSQNSTGSVDHPLLPIVTAGNGFGIRSGTPIQVRLRTAIDSGHVRNGAMVDATLAAPIGNLRVGTPVRLTVVQSSPAGRLTSYGQLSIQIVSIADRSVLSDTITAEGKEGPKELPDAAPARGTEAIFSPDQPITLPAA